MDAMGLLTMSAVCMASVGLAHGQGITPKPTPDQYPVHAELGKLILAADNLVHSVPTPRGVYLAQEYLVIEVAVYGPTSIHPDFNASQFQLRINNAKNPLLSTPAMFAAAGIQNPQWGNRPALTGEAGNGNGGIILNGPPQTPRFPGDPTGRRLPAPKTPSPNPNAPEQEPPASPSDLVMQSALPEGSHVPPYAGVLFFPFARKMKSVKSLELLYQGPLGTVTLKLP
jgi:hypothetical protein